MRSCDHRNIMILYQGFPNWGVPLVICKPLKSGTRAALCQEQGGGRSWFSADLEKTGKGCLGSECCSKCQTLPLWLLPCIKELLLPFSRREDSRRCKGREGSRGAALHTHIHCALTHENYSVPISPRLSGAQSSLPCTSELLDSPVPKASLTPPLPHCCSAAQGLPEQRGTLLSCSNPLTASPRKIQVWEAWYYSQTEKELEVSQDEWDIPTHVIWWGEKSAISFGFV